MRVNGFEERGIIKVDNAFVYGLEESIIASAYPMQTHTEPMCADYSPVTNRTITDLDLKRAKHLGKAVPGSGHDCFLKGVLLQFDLQVPEYIWRQLDRYHFIDYVSSQSKMHRIVKMDLDESCNKYVTRGAMAECQRFIDFYNNFEWYENLMTENGMRLDQNSFTLRNGEELAFTKENIFKLIIANCPCGVMLTARMSTNYLQLKSMINQRSNHKMQEWRLLTDWFKTLPMVEEMVMRQC